MTLIHSVEFPILYKPSGRVKVKRTNNKVIFDVHPFAVKNLSFLSVLIFYSTTLLSQNELFHQTYGGDARDYGSSVEQTKDGGFIMVGTTGSYGPSEYNVYLIKTYPNGDTAWTRVFG